MNGAGVGKGAEIAGAVSMDAAGHKDTRIVFLHRHLDIRVGLIVAQHDIVARAMLFNERVFQYERFHLVGYDDSFHIGGVAHHRRHLRRALGVVPDVAAHAITQIHGLADVNDLSPVVFPQVYAGLDRQISYLIEYGFTQGHGSSPSSSPSSVPIRASGIFPYRTAAPGRYPPASPSLRLCRRRRRLQGLNRRDNPPP